MEDARRMLVIADSTGRILASAPAGPTEDSEVTTGFEPLPGQVLHEIEIPEEIANLEAGDEIFSALMDFVVVPGESRLVRRYDR